jgi:hypothetical protein
MQQVAYNFLHLSAVLNPERSAWVVRNGPPLAVPLEMEQVPIIPVRKKEDELLPHWLFAMVLRLATMACDHFRNSGQQVSALPKKGRWIAAN